MLLDENKILIESLYTGLSVDNLPDKLRESLPAHKDDRDAVLKLQKLEYPEIAPILPHLMSWLEDLNWPISKDIADKLLKVGYPMIPYVQKVLRSDDMQWKYCVLVSLVSKMNLMCLNELRPDIEIVALHEDPEDAYVVARDILKKMKQ